MGDPVAPPGWPTGLPPPGHPDMAARSIGWLMDRLPPVVREYPQIHQRPVALALLCRHHCQATLTGHRSAYAAWRRELADELSPAEIDASLLAVEGCGHDASATLREVDLVLDALRGRRWRRRL